MIKRVVAVAGDTVQMKGGALVVNGVAQEEPFIPAAKRAEYEFGPVKVCPSFCICLMRCLMFNFYCGASVGPFAGADGERARSWGQPKPELGRARLGLPARQKRDRPCSIQVLAGVASRAHREGKGPFNLQLPRANRAPVFRVISRKFVRISIFVFSFLVTPGT